MKIYIPYMFVALTSTTFRIYIHLNTFVRRFLRLLYILFSYEGHEVKIYIKREDLRKYGKYCGNIVRGILSAFMA